jgi:dCTP diphosphatase
MKIDDLTEQIVDFRERRDWAQFHHPKELSSALSIEVAEIMELFRFKTADEVKEMLKEPRFRTKVGEELADSLFLLLLLAHESGVDLPQAFARKLEILEERYPEEKARGRSDKWTAYKEGVSE